MGKDYVVVDFLELDTKLFSILEMTENGFGGYSAKILYDGKKLYVKYGKRQCRMGIMRWSPDNYSISVTLRDYDEYFKKAYELDSFFMETFGMYWSPIVRGDTFGALDFKVKVSGGESETVFFGKLTGYCLDDCVPRMSNIRVLALWDKISMGYGYGVVIRPRAIQIYVVDFKKYDTDETSNLFVSDEVRKFF